MVLTESRGQKLGFKAPDFSLFDTISGDTVSLSDLQGKNATLIMFICNHCPFVVHINKMIVELAKEYQKKGIAFVAISSNDASSYPQDGPENMARHAAEYRYNFPYLYDQTQEVAKTYQAVCTPDIFLFDKKLGLIYHGQLDDSRPGNNIPVTGRDIREACDSYLEKGEILEIQKASVGCSIKWKDF